MDELKRPRFSLMRAPFVGYVGWFDRISERKTAQAELRSLRVEAPADRAWPAGYTTGDSSPGASQWPGGPGTATGGCNPCLWSIGVHMHYE